MNDRRQQMVSPATFPVTAIMNQAPVGTPITLNRTVYQQESIGVIGSELVSALTPIMTPIPNRGCLIRIPVSRVRTVSFRWSDPEL